MYILNSLHKNYNSTSFTHSYGDQKPIWCSAPFEICFIFSQILFYFFSKFIKSLAKMTF